MTLQNEDRKASKSIISPLEPRQHLTLLCTHTEHIIQQQKTEEEKKKKQKQKMTSEISRAQEKTMAAEKRKDEVPAKKPFGVMDFAVGTLFGGFFCAAALSDFSAGLFFQEDTAFADYVRWKTAAPILSQIILLIAVLLPLVIFGLIKDVFNIFTHHATLKRNILDVCHLVLLSTVLFVVIGKVQPTEKLLLEAAAKNVAPDAFAKLQNTLTLFYGIVWVLNLFMLVLPFLRWSDEAKKIAKTSIKQD